MNRTRKIMSVLLVIVMAATAFWVTGCNNDPFENMNELVFDVLFDRENANTLNIRSIDAYFHNGTYYYEVKAVITDPETEKLVDFHYVFFGKGALDNSIDLTLSDFGNKESDRQAFLTAKKDGEHKRLEKEFVDQKFDDHFHNQGVNYVTINPTKEEFEAANRLEYGNTSETILDQSIKEPYEVDLFAYKAPVGGYYKIYSQGKADTLGKVFKKIEFMGKTTGYEAITTVVDGNGEELNFMMVPHLEVNTRYYIGVRGFNTATGDYSLKIEPNDDKVYSNIGGIWINDNVSSGTAYKMYLNKYQVEEIYKILLNEDALSIIRTEYRKNGIFGALDGLQFGGMTHLSYYPADYGITKSPDSDTLKVVPSRQGESVLTTQAVLSQILEMCCVKSSVEELRTQLENVCKITKSGKAGNGIIITRENSFWGEKLSYSEYTGIEMTGELYERGIWY